MKKKRKTKKKHQTITKPDPKPVVGCNVGWGNLSPESFGAKLWCDHIFNGGPRPYKPL